MIEVGGNEEERKKDREKASDELEKVVKLKKELNTRTKYVLCGGG